tara:strand:+ start:133 stop:495 length:363 start_codon:yes stop_codon:yes gene_type:complete
MIFLIFIFKWRITLAALEITDSNFNEEVLNADLPVLVDFWAEWCGPCKMVSPIVEELSEEYTGKIKVTKLDVDSNPQTAASFGIRGIPTLLMFKDGAAVDQIVGAVPKTTLKERLDQIIS